jgi:hypothetical protein
MPKSAADLVWQIESAGLAYLPEFSDEFGKIFFASFASLRRRAGIFSILRKFNELQRRLWYTSRPFFRPVPT